jgi:KaiC/GvpD/RAD55 family RecA-like ATPase
VAGAPGAGKTTLVQQILFANATNERSALYFTVLGEPTVKMLRYQQQFGFFRRLEGAGRDPIRKPRHGSRQRRPRSRSGSHGFGDDRTPAGIRRRRLVFVRLVDT